MYSELHVFVPQLAIMPHTRQDPYRCHRRFTNNARCRLVSINLTCTILKPFVSITIGESFDSHRICYSYSDEFNVVIVGTPVEVEEVTP